MTATARSAHIAIIGTGAIAQVVHLPILTRMRGVEVLALLDSDTAKARTLAERFSVPRVHRSLDDILEDDEIEAIVVCTPNHAHEAQVLEGLNAGKYVFCEKPLALTAEGSARVLAADGAGGRLMVGMNQRFRPDSAALKSFVAAGDLGEIQYVSAGWLNRRLGRSSRSWRHRKAGAGGGALMDLGIQMLDLALWLLDYPEPERIVAHLHASSGSEVEDSAVLLLQLADDRVINLDVTWTLVADRERQYMQVIGSRGSGYFPPLRVFKDTDSGLLDVSPQLAQGRENQFTASYRQELAHFVDAVRAEQPIQKPVEQVSLMTIVEAAYRSASEGREIRFADDARPAQRGRATQSP
jgi:predicted dehydrogenase